MSGNRFKDDRLLICATNGEARSIPVHATRSERLRAANGLVTGHISKPVAICGSPVRIFHPYQPAERVLVLNETRACPDCLDRIIQMRVDAACGNVGH